MHPLRRSHYEAFYFLHILLVPPFLVVAGLHHPPVWYWCWVALGLWIGERLWRATWWLSNNGYFGGMTPSVQLHQSVPVRQLKRASVSSHFRVPFEPIYLPPTGYAHAELLSGRTVRLRYISPGPFSWAPGQHFLINIPSVSRFTSHPFTAATVCDERSGDSGRELVFLGRAKKGWTKELWDTVVKLMARHQSHPPGERPTKGTEAPPRGVLMRMYVDGPFGSSVRARWGSHSTVLIVAGGSGVSFGLSILEFMSMCLSGRDGKHLGGWGNKSFLTARVRFVWLVREFCK